MNGHRSSAELKASAKEHMFGHYGTAIGASLLVTFCTGFFMLMALSFAGDTSTTPGLILYYAITFAISVLAGLFTSGTAYFYLKIACGQHVIVSDVFCGFRFCPDKALLVQAWIALISFLFDLPELFLDLRLDSSSDIRMLLLSLAGIILSLTVSVIINLFYGQAFFLLHDFPQYSGRELLAVSRKLMAGNKGRLLYIYISFIPYLIPCLLSCGIAMLWIQPYMKATLAEFYLDLVQEKR